MTLDTTPTVLYRFGLSDKEETTGFGQGGVKRGTKIDESGFWNRNGVEKRKTV